MVCSRKFPFYRNPFIFPWALFSGKTANFPCYERKGNPNYTLWIVCHLFRSQYAKRYLSFYRANHNCIQSALPLHQQQSYKRWIFGVPRLPLFPLCYVVSLPDKRHRPNICWSTPLYCGTCHANHFHKCCHNNRFI